MDEVNRLLAAVRSRRLLSVLFGAGFLLAMTGNLVGGTPIGLRAAFGIGVMFALIPLGAALVSAARTVVGFALLLALIAVLSYLRASVLRWSSRRESVQVEQLIARSYDRKKWDR